MKPVSPERIEAAKVAGLDNVEAIARACRRADVSFAVACALATMESGGRNIYGHDLGGCFSTATGPVTLNGVTYPKGSDIPVTHANFTHFLIRVMNGVKSNGVGLTQQTWAATLGDGRSGGWFRVMSEDRNLDPVDPEDNMVQGLLELKADYVRTRSWVKAGAIYNGRESYGITLDAEIRDWRKLLHRLP